jgi:hypothetical protein
MSGIPWLPDPADYSAPSNWSAADLVHPSGQAPDLTAEAATSTAVDSTAAEVTAPPAPAAVEAEITPYPPAAPTVDGPLLTENVNQAGA